MIPVWTCFATLFLQLPSTSTLRVKRDIESFASDFGGPVAKSIDIGDPNANPTEWKTKKARFVSANNLYDCELDEEKMAEQRNKKSAKILHRERRQEHSNQQNTIGNSTKDRTHEKFESYKRKYNRQYKVNEDLERKFGHFKDNLDKIDKIKASRISKYDAQVDVTKFADSHSEKFKVHHSGTLKPHPEAVRRINFTPKKPVCQKLQWTSKHIFPQVHDQLYCGSCYAISVADLISAQNKVELGRFDGHAQSLSAQYIVDCLSPPDAFSCNGGHPAQVLNQLSKCRKKSGHCMLPKESCYKYTGENGTCQLSCPPEKVELVAADMLDIQGLHEMDIMANLLKWGPVIAIVGVSETWQFYSGNGVMRPRQCTTDQSHAVIVTGYDYTTCVPTYTVRNSWGTDWGAKGHIKLEAGKNTCGIAQSVIYGCSNKCGSNPTANFDYVMQSSNFPGC